MLLYRIIVPKKLVRDGSYICANMAVRSTGRTSQSTESTAAAAKVPAVREVIQPIKQGSAKLQKISRAMQSYLERAQKYEDFMCRQNAEFSTGKRHLANMMGWDPDNITQEDVDRAIAYLLPSGLFEPRARPMMKPPEEIFPREKSAEFDAAGRPYHYMFYTGKPHFYATLHDAVSEFTRLNSRLISSKAEVQAATDTKVDLTGSRWFKKEELETLLVERITDNQYDYFIRTLTRLTDHPLSIMSKEFIMRFRKRHDLSVTQDDIAPLKHDDAGNPYVEARGYRKSCIAKVTVRGNGTGRFVLNGCITAQEYFPRLKDRIQLMFPLQFTGFLNKMDIEGSIFYWQDEYCEGEKAQLAPDELQGLLRRLQLNEGISCEAGALRLAISKALCSFVSKEEVESMRLAGLLTRDLRLRERKKPGQMGARRKYTWRKR